MKRLLIVGAVLAGAEARADEPIQPGDLPVRTAERPLTVPKYMVSTSLAFAHVVVRQGTVTARASAIAIGANIGVTDDVEIEVVPLSLALTPTFALGNLRVGITKRLTRGAVEVGVRTQVTAVTGPTQGAKGVLATLGLPFLVRLGAYARFDTGLFLSGRYSSGENLASAGLPLALTVSPGDRVRLGLTSGVDLPSFGGNGPHVPLFLRAGVTLGQHALVDLDALFGYPVLAGPGGIHTNIWVVGGNITAFIPRATELRAQ